MGATTRAGAGFWSGVAGRAPFQVNTALLLTDGTVICQEDCGFRWARLTPDNRGCYMNGRWSIIPSMIDSRRYYASAVLGDARVIVAGGEDSDQGNGTDIATVEIWDPSGPTDGWNAIRTPGWRAIGDAPCCVLADGRFLLGSIDSTSTAIYDPATSLWIGSGNKHDASSEETWTLLPDGSVLCVECSDPPSVERYVPATDSWVTAGMTPPGHELVEDTSKEIGPAILMPDQRVLALGATGHTAIYTPARSGRADFWSGGPDLPLGPDGNTMVAKDSPACLLPNGRVLCAVGPAVDAAEFPPHTCFCEFDGATFLRVADPVPFDQSGYLYDARLLLLPTGEVLYTNSTDHVYLYTPHGRVSDDWRPTITYCASNVSAGQTYALRGTQLNGLSQGCSYGDDASMATNYPLVRIQHNNEGVISYCRTFGHSTMAVATGASLEWTNFVPPAGIPTGPSELFVVANGIPSVGSAILVV
jgi:hypothetical protein